MKRILIIALIIAVARGLSFALSALAAFLNDQADLRTPTKHQYVSALVILYYIVGFISLLFSMLMWVAPVLYFVSIWPKVFSVIFYLAALGLSAFLAISFCSDVKEHYDLLDSHFFKAWIASIVNCILLNWLFNFAIAALNTAFTLSDLLSSILFFIPTGILWLSVFVFLIVITVQERRARVQSPVIDNSTTFDE